ncbi:thioesterase II family protein, partial [Frankia sp. CcWB2]
MGAERNAGLICFPYPAQRVRTFATIADLLAPSVAVAAVQCFTWTGRPGSGQVESTVVPAVREVAAEWADCLLVIFGHRAGAWLAFEVARRLETSQIPLAGLFASASPAPSRGWRGDAAVPLTPGGPDEDVVDGRGPLDIVRCPITVLAGDADQRTTVRDAYAWSEHTSGAFDIRIFPGDDRYIDSHPRDVANAISDQLLSTRREGDGNS